MKAQALDSASSSLITQNAMTAPSRHERQLASIEVTSLFPWSCEAMTSMSEGLRLPGGADFRVDLRIGAMMETVKLHHKAVN